MRKRSRLIACLLSTLIILLSVSMQAECAVVENKSASDVVADISVGWNLGNTLESSTDKAGKIWNESLNIDKESYYETLFGNPKTTYEMIETVKKAGFNAIRIPVTYYNHLDDYGKIDEKWLIRVGEVVQYVLDNDMYAIINIHHETGKGNKRIQANLDKIDHYKAYSDVLWKQIASYFKDYDYRLMFEGFNETLDMAAKNPWYGNESSWKAMNMLNQSFVDVVRASGGKNSTRNLIVNTYGAQITYGPLYYFEFPQDKVAGHIIVGVHSFTSNVNSIKTNMDVLNKYFLKNGYPVIISEMGSNSKTSMPTRITGAQSYKVYAEYYGIKSFWWDDGGNYKLLNRKNNTWYYPEVLSALVQQ